MVLSSLNALIVFRIMLSVGMRPNSHSITSVLAAAAEFFCFLLNITIAWGSSLEFAENLSIMCARSTYSLELDRLKKLRWRYSRCALSLFAMFRRTSLNDCRILEAFKFSVYAVDRVPEFQPSNAATCLMVVEMHNAFSRSCELRTFSNWWSNEMREKN